MARYPRESWAERYLSLPLLGLIACVMAYGAFSNPDDTPDKRMGRLIRTNLAALHSLLEQFHQDCGRYPTTAEGLNALVVAPKGLSGWRGPYIDKSKLLDAWDDPYNYRSPAVVGKGPFDLWTYGADGMAGGTGAAADFFDGESDN